MLGKEHTFFILLAIAFMLGVATAYLASVFVLASTIVASLAIYVVSTRNTTTYQSRLLQGLLLALVMVAGFTRASIDIDGWRHHELDEQIGQEVILEGVVTSEVRVRESYSQLTLTLSGYETKLLLSTAWYPEYHYGDVLSIEGVLQRPEAFSGEDGRYFDYPHYLAREGIRYTMRYAQIEQIGEGEGALLQGELLALKGWFVSQIRSALREPHAALLAGLLVGAKEAMGEDLLDDFRDTGVIHIVVLSGFNITIVAWFFMSIFGYLGPRTAAVCGSVAILFFALMTGAGATVVRASLMAFLVIVARLTGNYAHMLRLLFMAAIIMLVYNPKLLLYDPSFQLSFVATFGLISFAPWVESRLGFIPSVKGAPLRELVAATIATQIIITPLLLYMMGTFATYAPLANFLILALVPYTMLLGFLTALAQAVSFSFALPLVYPTYALLEYELTVVEFIADLPGASFAVPAFSFAWVVVAYTLYAGLWWWYTYQQKTRKP